MSEITSRSKVNSVTSVSAGQSGMGGAILAAIVVGSVLKLLGSATRKAVEGVTPALPQDALKTITPLSDVRDVHQKIAHSTSFSSSLPAIEAVKATALASLATATYRITDEARLKQHLVCLCNATSISEARLIERQLIELCEVEHQYVMTRTLRLACSNASIKAGFPSIQSMPPGPAGVTRLVASNPSGQSLITEITAHADGHHSIETEVVGVMDGRCRGILDQYDRFLEEEGVRSEPPKRSTTGGVCELAAAREFVRSKVARTIQTEEVRLAAAQGTPAKQRTRRLNTSQTTRRR